MAEKAGQLHILEMKSRILTLGDRPDILMEIRLSGVMVGQNEALGLC